MLKYEPTRRSGSRSYSPHKTQLSKPKFHITKDDDYERKSRSSRRSRSKSRRSRSRSGDRSRDGKSKSRHYEERRQSSRKYDRSSPEYERGEKGRRYPREITTKVPSNLAEDTIKTTSGLILHIVRDESPPPRRVARTYDHGHRDHHHHRSSRSTIAYSGDSQNENEYKLYIENITPEATAKQLYEVLAPSAQEGRLQIDLLPLRPGHQARIAFARFSSKSDADHCLKRNYNVKFLGNEIMVSWKKEKT